MNIIYLLIAMFFLIASILMFLDRVFLSKNGFEDILVFILIVVVIIFLILTNVILIMCKYPNFTNNSTLIILFFIHSFSTFSLILLITVVVSATSYIDAYLKNRNFELFGYKINLLSSNIFENNTCLNNTKFLKLLCIFSYIMGVVFTLFVTGYIIGDTPMDYNIFKDDLNRYYNLFIVSTLPIILSILKK